MRKTKFQHFGFPRQPSKEELSKIYEGKIPRAEKFLNMKRRIRLMRFTAPFKGNGREVAAKLGCNLDAPLARSFEQQLDEFVTKTLDIHWSKEIPVAGGMITVLERMGRAGVLYRHGFSPITTQQMQETRSEKIARLESEISQLRQALERRRQFEEERETKRQEALHRFNHLHQEDQYDLLREFDYAQWDRRIIARGGKFEDFLIVKFGIKVTLFERIHRGRKIQRRLEEIRALLKETTNKFKANQIDFNEFARIYKSTLKELDEMDRELDSLKPR